MKMNTLSRINYLILLFALFLMFIQPTISFAGGGSVGLKGKIQQKLDAPRNVQYEPYYLQTDYNVNDNKAVNSPPNEPDAQQGYQSSSYRSDMPVSEAVERSGLNESGQRQAALQSASSYAIYNMKYSSELEENVVTVKGEVLFEVFNNTGATQLPLVSNNVGLIDVRVNKGASFVVSQGGMYYLIMSKPGRYTLDFEFLIKATREREHGPGSFRVDVIPAPISQFEFLIPEKDIQVFIEPAIKVETTTVDDKTTAWAVLPNASHLNVRWTKALPKEEIVVVKLDPKIYAETSTYATIGGGVISNTTNINYSILQSEVSNLRVALPEDVSVLNVQGSDLRDWKVSVKEGTQYLDVFLNFGVKGNYKLNFTFERNITEGSVVVQMPWVKTLNTERENGYYGIAASTNVELAVKSSDKVTAVDPKQLPAVIWGSSSNPILLAFKYLNPPFDITIEVTRHEELPVLVAAIDSVSIVTLHTKDGKILTKATYQLRNNVKQFLRINLPEQSKIWSSFVAGKPVKPAVDKQGNVLLPLEKSQMQGRDLTQFPVEVVYLTEGSKMDFGGGLKLVLPKVDVPISQFNWMVYLPFDYTYYGFKSDMRKDEDTRNFFARGIQGRLRNAADDIGDQFSVGVSQQSAVQTILSESKDMMAKGILPITVNVPQEGKMYSFSKLLVVEDEAPWMSVQYTSLLDKIQGPVEIVVKLIFILTGIFILYKLFCRFWRKKK